MGTILIIVVAILLLGVVGAYNGLVRKRNEAENAFGAIDAMLKKRYDLIPNLIAAVQKYADHEYKTFAKVVELRSKPYSQFSDEEKAALDREFSAARRNFNLVAENYPNLKASDNFLHLQSSLNETEEQISAARRTYNAAITSYNNSVETFPTNLMAGMMHFTRKPVLETTEEERKNIDVKDLFKRQ